MKICNYFCGSTGRITGFVYDTENKTYKDFVLRPDEWIPVTIKMPGDITYFFSTLNELKSCQKKLRKLGFVKDNTIPLAFT